jgi:aminopeptidase YwaD
MIKYFFLFLLLAAIPGTAQSPHRTHKKTVRCLKKSVTYLADDRLQGRRTGTAGEKLAYEYISKKFKKAGLLPYGDGGSYLQAFEVNAKEKRTGHNVVGFINNKAASTIILGAHFDHLGYGEDKNSMYTGTTPMIHNGADDNASGTAALLELGKWLKKSTLKKYNHLLGAFSGEELGLFGSKYFTEHNNLPAGSINYMINMDMVGRLNDSSHSINVGGYGTSPAWGQLIKTEHPFFKIKIDSSGTGPSDHTSFYRKDIPVLFFFTGTHSDYHKPSDDPDKINYHGIGQILGYIKNILTQTNQLDKLIFTKTREVSMGSRTSFKVSLGIMPDYTFSGPGVYVDGVSSGKPAEKAGILKADIILQLGEHLTPDVEGYMKALGKFDKGQTTQVKIKRGDKELLLPINF